MMRVRPLRRRNRSRGLLPRRHLRDLRLDRHRGVHREVRVRDGPLHRRQLQSLIGSLPIRTGQLRELSGHQLLRRGTRLSCLFGLRARAELLPRLHPHQRRRTALRPGMLAKRNARGRRRRNVRRAPLLWILYRRLAATEIGSPTAAVHPTLAPGVPLLKENLGHRQSPCITVGITREYGVSSIWCHVHDSPCENARGPGHQPVPTWCPLSTIPIYRWQLTLRKLRETEHHFRSRRAASAWSGPMVRDPSTDTSKASARAIQP